MGPVEKMVYDHRAVAREEIISAQAHRRGAAGTQDRLVIFSEAPIVTDNHHNVSSSCRRCCRRSKDAASAAATTTIQGCRHRCKVAGTAATAANILATTTQAINSPHHRLGLQQPPLDLGPRRPILPELQQDRRQRRTLLRRPRSRHHTLLRAAVLALRVVAVIRGSSTGSRMQSKT
jgi:hypothetical protein